MGKGRAIIFSLVFLSFVVNSFGAESVKFIFLAGFGEDTLLVNKGVLDEAEKISRVTPVVLVQDIDVIRSLPKYERIYIVLAGHEENGKVGKVELKELASALEKKNVYFLGLDYCESVKDFPLFEGKVDILMGNLYDVPQVSWNNLDWKALISGNLEGFLSSYEESINSFYEKYPIAGELYPCFGIKVVIGNRAITKKVCYNEKAKKQKQ